MSHLIKYFVLVFIITLATQSFGQNVGMNTKTPSSRLTVNGSFATDYKIVTANTTLGIADYYTAYNGSSNGTITLPAAIAGAGNFKGRIYCIKNTSSMALTVAASAPELIDGVAPMPSVIIPPGYYIKLINKGTTSGGTWEFFMLANGKTDAIDQISGAPYAVPPGPPGGAPSTTRFFVNDASPVVVYNSSNTFTLPVSKPIFLSFALGIDDYTALPTSQRPPAPASYPYFRCELYIDNQPSGLYQIIRQGGDGVSSQLQFNFSGILNLSAGSHTIDARIIRWYNNGYTGNQDFRPLSVLFDAVYLN